MQSTKDSPLPMAFTWSGSRNSHGIDYERDLALTLFVAASLEERSFRLATEMNVAGKFDDAVLILDDRKEVWFYQAKHSQTSNAEIEFEEFFPSSIDENSQFSLPMYIQSYLNVSQRSEFKNYKKRFIIYSNKSIKENTRAKLGELVHIQNCAINAPLEKKVYIRSSEKFVPRADQVQNLLHKINKLPIAIKDAIIDLQQSGTVKSILRKYTTPLRSILEIDGAVRFSEKFTEHEDDINQQWLWYALQTHFTSKRLSEVEFHKKIDKRMLQNKSGEKSFPRFIKESDVRSFFDCLVICTDQPDKLFRLRDSITESAVAEWIHEKDRGLFSDRTKFHVIFEKEFDIWHMVTNMNGNQKPFLSSYEGTECIHMAKAEVRRILQKITEADFNNYVERKLVFENEQEELTEDGFISILERSSGRNDYYILVGEPGMGKTTFMKKITYALQTDFNKHVYLICLSRLFKNYKKENNIFSLIKSDISKSIQQLIQNSLECCPQQCFILLDGYDEIDNSHQDAAIKLVKETFCKSNIRVFISGRNHLKKTLEKVLQAKPLNLIPLVEDEQLLFLKNYWDISSGINEIDFDRFQRFAKHLLKALHDDIHSVYFRFTGLPLIVRMLAEVYKKTFEEYWGSSKANITEILDSKTRFSVLHLYENFVNISFNIFVKKINNEEGYAIVDSKILKFFKNNLENFYRAHELIAIHQINIPKLQNSLNYDDSVTILENMQQILDNGEKSLLVNVSNENQLEFTHLSFAEYFLSKFLYEHVAECEANLFEVLEKYEVVRAFFFSMVEENWDKSTLQMNTINRICHNNPEIMYVACADGYESILKELLNHHNARVIFWSLKRSTLLHAAVKSKRENILKLVLCKHRFGNCTQDYVSNSILRIFSANINTPDSLGALPIHYAVSDGNKPFVEMLAQHGADIKCQDLRGATPLHNAAKNGDWDMINMLTTGYAANPNIRDSRGQTILHVAAAKRDAYIVQMMIERLSCDVNDKDQWDNTPLHLAAQHSSLEMVKMLIDKYKADYKSINNRGKSLIHFAAVGGNVKILKMLIDDYAADVNAQDYFKISPLLFAAKNYRWELVKMLIDKKSKYSADYKIADEFGKTIIDHAVQGDNIEIVEIIIDYYATDNNMPDNYINKTLHIAAIYGKREMVKILIEKYDANYKYANVYGQTPIHLAAEKGNMEIVMMLIDDYAIDVNLQDYFGNTPLHLAAKHYKWGLVKMLIDKNFKYSENVNINVVNQYGQTLIHLAAEKGNIEILEILIDDYATDVNLQDYFGNTALHLAAEHYNWELVKMLIDKDSKNSANLYILNRQGQTIMHLAAKRGNMEISKMLIDDHAIDVNLQDNHGNTPLHIAAAYLRWELVKILIGKDFKNSANHRVANKNGQTLIHLTAAAGNIEVLEMIMEDNATDVNAQDSYGNTPLHLAAFYGARNMVNKLISEYRANHKVANKDGQTLIHLATKADMHTFKMIVAHYTSDVNKQDNDGNTSLHFAVFYGKQEIVKMLIYKYNADFKIVNNRGKTLIHYAAEVGNLQIMQMLISSCVADINAQDNDGNTPLHLAALNKKWGIVTMLIYKYNADFKIVNNRGKTLIHYVDEKEHMGIVKMLLDDYATDVNAQDNDGKTPLHFAAERYNMNIVKILMDDYAADVKAQDNYGRTPLHLAVLHSNQTFFDMLQYLQSNMHLGAKDDMEILKMLLDATDVNAQDSNGSTPLHFATFNGNPEIVKMLIDEYKADYKITTKDGQTLVHVAATTDNLEIIDMLIDAYAIDINKQDNDGNSPLHFAAFYGKREMVKMLIVRHQADYKIANNRGKTIIHYAAERENMEIVQMLIDDYATDVNVQDNDGNTPLHFAAFYGKRKMVKMLIDKYNADYKICDNRGKALIHYAVTGDNIEIVKILIDDYATDVNAQDNDGNTPLHFAAFYGNREMVQMLIDKYNADYKIVSNRGKALIHYAAERENMEIVKILIDDYAADVNAQDNDGNTPLHFAAFYGKREMVKMLIDKYNADYKICDNRGKVLIHYAAAGDNIEIVKMLIDDYGTDVNAQDSYGNTPLHFADFYGKLEMVRMLIDRYNAC
ncbi:hypothetical protein RP20_CCG013108 [Aedes albopictus]|nr:hypothetical protein RP20_CCG013108 [Aedes albopictus]